mgnify:CR=1 FL=1
MDAIFKGVFDNELTQLISVQDFLLCLGVSLVLGLIMAAAYMFKNEHTKSFLVTLALLPAVVCVVIMMVNGNIGAGVATAGAFSLVRFRSVPGTAKDISALFCTMAIGFILGMGYLWFALLFAALVNVILLALALTPIAEPNSKARHLSVVMPESIDYTTVFDAVFAKYLKSVTVIKVKTTNLGSMFEVRYDILLKDVTQEKEFIDELRCRNGNLPIALGRIVAAKEVL